MQAIRFIYFANDGQLNVGGTISSVEGGTLVVALPGVTARSDYTDGVISYGFTIGDLHQLHRDIADMLAPTACGFEPAAAHSLSMPVEVARIVMYLANGDRRMTLSFLWLYGLTVDAQYFSSLLVKAVDGTREFFEYVEENSLNAWPASQYAEKLGLSMRKLNLLFQEQFGMSAKRWLIERRLVKARELLSHTSMTVTQVAQQCGFNSHAHFSESFKKRYKRCPRATRQSI